MNYTADFETTTDPDDCRVWAWAVATVEDNPQVTMGNTIEGFMEFIEGHLGDYYFHNLAFDGSFIVNHLYRAGYVHSDQAVTHGFSTLISNMGKWYEIVITFRKSGRRKPKQVKIMDSLKKLPFSVSSVAKTFNLPISKLEIDYSEYREPGHELTQEERDYITNDVTIMAMALNIQFNQGLTRMTIGSDALNYYKGTCFDWNGLFPKLPIELDGEIRRAYRGGWTYCNPKFQATEEEPDKTVGEGIVLDVNSLYPDVMYNRPLPVGNPMFFHGKYEDEGDYPLYIQRLSCAFDIKPDHLPMIQIKDTPAFWSREYVTRSLGYVDLSLTSVDLELFLQQYDVDVISWNGGMKFMQFKGLFKRYIDHWMKVKQENKGGLRQLAKLMLNSLYGKFATNPDVTGKVPILDDGTLRFKKGEENFRDPVYTPLAAFVTAWARYKTVNAAQDNYERFLYADTDSLHLLGTHEPNLDIHPTKLGAWAHESTFRRARYLRAKSYLEEIVEEDGRPCDPHLDCKCAGLPHYLSDVVNFDNFYRGLSIYGKLMPCQVPGGVVLKETTFTIK